MNNAEQPLRVAEIVASLEVGGAERVAITLAGGLRKYGWETWLVTLAGKPEDTDLEQPLIADAQAQGIKVVGLPFRNWKDAASRKRLVTFLKDNNIDLVHVHNRPVDWQISMLARLNGIRALYTRHMVKPSINAGARWIYRLAGRLAPKTVVVSKVVGDHLTEVEWVPDNRKEIIYNGIDLNRFHPASAEERAAIRGRLGLEPDDILWFTAHRLNPRKGLQFFLPAVAQLPPNPHRKIWVAGDGPQRQDLEQLCQSLGIENQIKFLGSRSDIAQLLQAADVYFTSTRAEGHPISLLEAMATGLPIVAPRIQVIRETVPEHTARLYGPEQGEMADKHEPADIAAAMVAMEENPDQRELLGKAALAYVVENYSEDATLQAHDKLYRQLLG